MDHLKNIFLIFKIFIIVLTIIIVFYLIDFNEVINIFSNINLLYLIVIIPTYFIAQIISAQRFVYVSDTLGFHVSLIKSSKVHFIGMWFSNIMPTSFGGDIIKAGFFKNQMGWLNAISAQLLDRASGLIFLLGTMLILFPLYIKNFEINFALLTLVLSFSILFIIVLFAYIAKFLMKKKIHSYILWIVKTFYDLRLFIEYKRLLEQLWVSALIHLNGIIAYYFIGLSIGINLDFLTYLLIVPLIFLISLLPISFAGWGVRELSAIALFNLVGVDVESALATSLIFGFLIVIISLPGLFIFLGSKKIKSI